MGFEVTVDVQVVIRVTFQNAEREARYHHSRPAFGPNGNDR